MAFYATVVTTGTSSFFRTFGAGGEYRLNGGTWSPFIASSYYGLSSVGTYDIRDTGGTINQVQFTGEGVSEIDITDASDLTSASSLCQNITSLIECSVSVTNSITTFLNAFNGCTGLTTVNAMVTSSCLSTDSMFQGASSLVTVPSMDYSGVTTGTDMFRDATSLVHFYGDIGGDSQYLFSGCSSLLSIRGSMTLTDYGAAFYDCPNLEYIGAINTIGAANNDIMFGVNTDPSTPNAATQALLETTSMSWTALGGYITNILFGHGNRTVVAMTEIPFEHGNRTVDTRIDGTFELKRYIYSKNTSSFSIKRMVGSNTLQTQRFRSVRKIEAETVSGTIISRST